MDTSCLITEPDFKFDSHQVHNRCRELDRGDRAVGGIGVRTISRTADLKIAPARMAPPCQYRVNVRRVVVIHRPQKHYASDSTLELLKQLADMNSRNAGRDGRQFAAHICRCIRPGGPRVMLRNTVGQ